MTDISVEEHSLLLYSSTLTARAVCGAVNSSGVLTLMNAHGDQIYVPCMFISSNSGFSRTQPQVLSDDNYTSLIPAKSRQLSLSQIEAQQLRRTLEEYANLWKESQKRETSEDACWADFQITQENVRSACQLSDFKNFSKSMCDEEVGNRCVLLPAHHLQRAQAVGALTDMDSLLENIHMLRVPIFPSVLCISERKDILKQIADSITSVSGPTKTDMTVTCDTNVESITDFVEKWHEFRCEMGLRQKDIVLLMRSLFNCTLAASSLCNFSRLAVPVMKAIEMRHSLGKLMRLVREKGALWACQQVMRLEQEAAREMNSIVRVDDDLNLAEEEEAEQERDNEVVENLKKRGPLHQGRFMFNEEQLQTLHAAFRTNPNPNKCDRIELSDQLGVPYQRVRIWFQNNRYLAKLKKQQ